MDDDASDTQALVDQILDVFAEEARIDRARLTLDARASDLDIQSLDLAIALFEIEERFGVHIEGSLSEGSPTVGQIVQQVLDGRAGAASAAAAAAVR